MTTREASIQVAATPAEVFNVIAAFAEPPPFAAISRLSPRGGLGAVYQVDTRAFAASFSHVFTVDTYAPPRSLGLASVGRDNFWFTVDYHLEPLDDITEVAVRICAQATGRWRIVQPLLGGILEHAARDAVSRAKNICERSASDHPPQAPALASHSSPAASDDLRDAPRADPEKRPGASTQEAGGSNGQV